MSLLQEKIKKLVVVPVRAMSVYRLSKKKVAFEVLQIKFHDMPLDVFLMMVVRIFKGFGQKDGTARDFAVCSVGFFN
jgi:hypothetical protein